MKGRSREAVMWGKGVEWVLLVCSVVPSAWVLVGRWLQGAGGIEMQCLRGVSGCNGKLNGV